MKELGIAQDAGKVSFGQLYGMCDQVSFLLGKGLYCLKQGPLLEMTSVMLDCANQTFWQFPFSWVQKRKTNSIESHLFVFVNDVGKKGFSVYKSVPYGPVGEALAYLARRATENKDVIKRTEKERSLLKQELKRRITASWAWYCHKWHYFCNRDADFFSCLLKRRSRDKKNYTVTILVILYYVQRMNHFKQYLSI